MASRYSLVFNDIQIFLLLSLVEEYVNGAQLQIQRVERTRKVITKTLQSRRIFENTNWSTHKNRQQKLFLDAHYFFICLGQICVMGDVHEIRFLRNKRPFLERLYLQNCRLHVIRRHSDIRFGSGRNAIMRTQKHHKMRCKAPSGARWAATHLFMLHAITLQATAKQTFAARRTRSLPIA